AVFLARPNAGNNIEARMAMMAMTTSSSIKVNARGRRSPVLLGLETASTMLSAAGWALVHAGAAGFGLLDLHPVIFLSARDGVGVRTGNPRQIVVSAIDRSGFLERAGRPAQDDVASRFDDRKRDRRHGCRGVGEPRQRDLGPAASIGPQGQGLAG